jgi:hypothetical protein
LHENQPKRVLCVKTHLISTSFKTETESRLFQGCTTGVFGLPLCIRHRYPPLFGKEPKRDRQQIATHQASEKQMLPLQLRPTVRNCAQQFREIGIVQLDKRIGQNQMQDIGTI